MFHKDKVYVLSAFGELYCFDLKTGNTVWQKTLTQEFGVKRVPNWGYCGSPLVADGKLIVNPGGKAAVVAMRPETGDVVWQGEGGRPNYSSFSSSKIGYVWQCAVSRS